VKSGLPAEQLAADGEVLILSVMSDEEEDYPVRPVQEQIDYLTNVLGRKPRWSVEWPSLAS
jgi:hypothetical protein